MQKTKALYETVSISLIQDLIFNWVEGRYKKVITLSMSDYVLSEAEKRIKESEIWIPIFQLYIQSDIKIGRIVLKTITKEMIDNLQEKLKPNTPEQEYVAEQFFAKQRQKLQGFAAATIKLVAEPDRASEVAFEEAEKSISLLRFFAPANLLPEIKSYCTPLGKTHLESKQYLIIDNGEITGITDGLLNKYDPSWVVSDDWLISFRRTGLDILSDLLNKKSRTQFEDALLNSLFLYSKSSLTSDISEKLIYILSALEQVLLKNDTEPIQQNIGMRLSFLIGKTRDERISIKNNFISTYGLRSKFVHHGETIDDLSTLKAFMKNVWLGFFSLIQSVGRVETKEQLIKEIEDKIYS